MLPLTNINYFRCPVTGGLLEWMAGDKLAEFRTAAEESMLVNHAGELVTQVSGKVLVCHDAGLAYPVEQGIPKLVPAQAIALGQFMPPANPEARPAPNQE